MKKIMGHCTITKCSRCQKGAQHQNSNTKNMNLTEQHLKHYMITFVPNNKARTYDRDLANLKIDVRHDTFIRTFSGDRIKDWSNKTLVPESYVYKGAQGTWCQESKLGKTNWSRFG